MARLRTLIDGNELIVAPVALNTIMARLAKQAGFKAVYLIGGSLGWLKCVTETNLTLPELAAVAMDMPAVCDLPIVLDAGGGWDDPVHIHRTMGLSEVAGFDAVEIEDQVLPRGSTTISASSTWCWRNSLSTASRRRFQPVATMRPLSSGAPTRSAPADGLGTFPLS